jgi:hypothetical protein
MKTYFDFIEESTKATIRRHRAGVLTKAQRERFVARQQKKLERINTPGSPLSSRGSAVEASIRAVSNPPASKPSDYLGKRLLKKDKAARPDSKPSTGRKQLRGTPHLPKEQQ